MVDEIKFCSRIHEILKFTFIPAETKKPYINLNKGFLKPTIN